MANVDTHVAPGAAGSSCGDAFVAAAERALASGDLNAMPDAELRRVLTAAVRLYAAKVDVEGHSIGPVTAEQVTPTDVVVTVSDMIKAIGLNLWDLSMWFQRPQR